MAAAGSVTGGGVAELQPVATQVFGGGDDDSATEEDEAWLCHEGVPAVVRKAEGDVGATQADDHGAAVAERRAMQLAVSALQLGCAGRERGLPAGGAIVEGLGE